MPSRTILGCGLGVVFQQPAKVITQADTGSLKVPGYHVSAYSTAGGQNSSNGGAVASDTEAAINWKNCLTQSCNVSIAISGSGNGTGFSVTFDPNNIFGDKWYYKTSCQSEPPVNGGGGGGGGGGNICSGESPIILDTTGGGFHFSNPRTACVMFDLNNDGNPPCLSWPVAGSGNAWLVYDRDGDGVIKNGSELFGNHTPQPDFPNPQPNGFLALQEFNLPINGGNGDERIDANDAIWPKLKLWIDTHCSQTQAVPCMSLPSELHSLAEFGIGSLGFVYGADDKTDQYGNWFRLYAPVNIVPGVHDAQTTNDALGRRAYDVYLQVGGPIPQGACQ